MKVLPMTFIALATLAACRQVVDHTSGSPSWKGSGKYQQVRYSMDAKAPTVGITTYTLVTDSLQRDSSEARQLINAKVILPLAMQGHDAVLFDSTLAAAFVYQDEETFFNRAEYIQDRITAKWMISDVQYENLVLEFVDGYGILTYRNKVKAVDAMGKDQLYTWYWTDIWVKEGGRWKIKSLRGIN